MTYCALEPRKTSMIRVMLLLAPESHTPITTFDAAAAASVTSFSSNAAPSALAWHVSHIHRFSLRSKHRDRSNFSLKCPSKSVRRHSISFSQYPTKLFSAARLFSSCAAGALSFLAESTSIDLAFCASPQE